MTNPSEEQLTALATSELSALTGELERLLEASERHIKKIPWSVIPSDGKPIVAGHGQSGNIFRGYIATWEEADLTVAAINALPALIAGYRQLLAEGDGGTGWLIEHQDEHGSPSWLTLKPAEAMVGLVWTKESTEAVRFCRRSDAEDYYACHIDDAPNTFITEHAWGVAPTAPKLPTREEIARIVDHGAWRELDFWLANTSMKNPQRGVPQFIEESHGCRDSLSKADAILKLIEAVRG